MLKYCFNNCCLVIITKEINHSLGLVDSLNKKLPKQHHTNNKKTSFFIIEKL